MAVGGGKSPKKPPTEKRKKKKMEKDSTSGCRNSKDTLTLSKRGKRDDGFLEGGGKGVPKSKVFFPAKKKKEIHPRL